MEWAKQPFSEVHLLAKKVLGFLDTGGVEWQKYSEEERISSEKDRL